MNSTQGGDHFAGHFRQQMQKMLEQGTRDGGGGVCGLAAAAGKQHAHDKHGHDRPDGSQPHKTEAVVGRPAAAHGGHAHPQSHDERHRHRPRCHAARIKGHRPEIGRDKDAEHESERIKDKQQIVQRNAEHDAQHSDRHKDADADRNRENEQIVPERRLLCDSGHLLGKDLQIGFRDRHDDPDDKGQQRDQPDLARMRHGRAYLFTDDQHGHIRAQHKAAQPDNEQDDPDKKEHECTRIHRNKGDAQDKHNERYGQNGSQRFNDLIAESFRHRYSSPI